MSRKKRGLYKKTIARIAMINDLFPLYGIMTLRQIFYQLVHLGLSETQVQNTLLVGRRNGYISYENVADRSRASYGLNVWASMEDFIEVVPRSFKLDYWTDIENRVEIWTEKDALSQVIYNVSREFRVPVRVTRGFLSATKKKEWSGENLIVLYIGDFDPSGLVIDKGLKVDKYAELCCKEFHRIALTHSQISQFGLEDYAIKINPKDTRSKAYRQEYGDFGWEVDAIPPDKLRALIRDSIISYVDFDLDEKKSAENEIRIKLTKILNI